MQRRWRLALGGAALLLIAGALALSGPGGPPTMVRSGGPTTTPAVARTPAGCAAPSETVRLTGRAEVLRAGWLPEGFSLTNGREESPWGPWSPRYGAGPGREVWLTRTLTDAPPGAQVGAGPGGRVGTATVAGAPAALVETGGRVLLAWKAEPDVTVVVSTAGLGPGEPRRVAEAVVYRRAALGEGTVVSPCAPSMPAGAQTRAEVLAGLGGWAGADSEAKLVRLADVEAVQPGLLRCHDTPCDPGMVGWAVLGHDWSPRAVAPMSPPPQGPGWTFTVADAVTGAVRSGAASGPGQAPAFWASLVDLGP